MIARLLFAAAVLAAVIFGANCSFNPRRADCVAQQNEQFEGCFEAEITDPPGAGTIRLILDDAGQPATRVLGGCLELTLGFGRPVVVSLAGEASCTVNQQANLTGMLPGGESLTLVVLRQPATGNAATVDVTAEGSTLFTNALGVARCAEPVTCASLGMAVPFGAGGPP